MQGGPYSFRFRHNETSNSCRPQPQCARDIVRLSATENSESCLVNGIEYTMALIGFVDNFGNVRQVFRTRENRRNSADLLAVFKVRDREIQLTEPGLAGMLMMGGLATVTWRRRKNAV